MRLRVMRFLAFYFVSLSLACGPTVKKTPELSQRENRVIGMLPVNTDDEIRRERLDYLQTSLKRELQSSGYLVVDDALLSGECGGADCPRLPTVAKKFQIQTFAKLHIDSLYRANFLAGYLNTLHGNLRLFDSSGREIESIEHTEREKGGLVFNSGQVLEGLRSTSDNFGDDSFNRLGERFVKVLVGEVPPPKGATESQSFTAVKLAQVNTLSLGEGRYQFCAVGTTGGRASIVIDSQKTSLRELENGKYCGSLFLGGLIKPTTRMYLELRSPYGVVDRQEIEAKPFLLCDLSGLLKRDGATLSFGCSGRSEQERGACESQLSQCKDTQLIVFQGASEAGPFEKRGMLQSSWTDNNAATSSSSVYAVLAVSPRGTKASVLTLARSE